jgi:hypothetical protein
MKLLHERPSPSDISLLPLAVDTHLFDDDHAETMEAMSRPTAAPNVVPIRRRG